MEKEEDENDVGSTKEATTKAGDDVPALQVLIAPARPPYLCTYVRMRVAWNGHAPANRRPLS